MATVTKTFTFAASAESFVATAGAQSTLTWDSTTGNPAGALKARISGRSKTNSNFWEWTGTWEQLGVPAGSTVTLVRVNAAYTRCTEYNVGASSTIGPYELRDSGAVLQATLWAGRTVTGTDAAWVAVAAQADQSVPAGLQASSSTVKLRLADTLATGSNNAAAVSTYDDEVSYVITYTPGAQSGTFGSAALTLAAQDMGAVGGPVSGAFDSAALVLAAQDMGGQAAGPPQSGAFDSAALTLAAQDLVGSAGPVSGVFDSAVLTLAAQDLVGSQSGAPQSGAFGSAVLTLAAQDLSGSQTAPAGPQTGSFDSAVLLLTAGDIAAIQTVPLYVFEPPTATEFVYLSAKLADLFAPMRTVSLTTSTTVYRKDGVWYAVDDIDYATLESADAVAPADRPGGWGDRLVFVGGYRWVVSQAVRDVLVAAGYTLTAA